jgi:glycerol-3-phosphate dehydrogenase (NAD(P)+)
VTKGGKDRSAPQAGSVKGTAVIGAGSWGTALALHLARSGERVVLWGRNENNVRALQAARENTVYLPGHRFPPDLVLTHRLEDALYSARLVVFVVPAQFCRPVFRAAAPHLSPAIDLVIASKGIEEGSLLRLSEVLAREAGKDAGGRATVLSGPSFAAEVARGDPTAVVVAGDDMLAAARVQEILSRGQLRAYRGSDRVGVEIAAALKNVVAIATGIAEGLGFGTNTRAALITRGLAEIARLGTRLGGRAETFAGLAGTGDLVLTCTGALSRNRAVGIEVGRGRRLEVVLSETRMVAEGVATTRAVVALARRHGLEMPIAEKVYDVLFGGTAPKDAVTHLMARPLKEEA